MNKKQRTDDPDTFTAIIESFPSWNYKSINNGQLLYKIKSDNGSPVLQVSVKILNRLEIFAYSGTKLLDLISIENKIGSKLRPFNHEKLKILIAYLDTLEESSDRLSYVLKNFDSNLASRYPKSSAICRFCFCKEQSKDGQLESITLDFMRTYRTLTGLDLSLDSQLPSKGCRSCIQAISEAQNVREVAFKSERKLLKFHKEAKLKIKFEQLADSDESVSDAAPYEEPEMEIEALEEVNVRDNLVTSCKLEVEEPKFDDGMSFSTLDESQSQPELLDIENKSKLGLDEEADEIEQASTSQTVKFTEEEGYK